MVLIAYYDNRKVRLTELGKVTKAFDKRRERFDIEKIMTVAAKMIFRDTEMTLDNIKECASEMDWEFDDSTALSVYFMAKEFSGGDNI